MTTATNSRNALQALRANCQHGFGDSVVQVRSPQPGFGRRSDGVISLSQQSTQIPAQDEPIDNASEDSKRSLKVEYIRHFGAGWHLMEDMVVDEAGENALCHRVLKVPRSVELCDARCVAKSDSEVASLPGDGFTGTDQSGDTTGNSDFTVCMLRIQMQVDAA
jgi:hypothetical protein